MPGLPGVQPVIPVIPAATAPEIPPAPVVPEPAAVAPVVPVAPGIPGTPVIPVTVAVPPAEPAVAPLEPTGNAFFDSAQAVIQKAGLDGPAMLKEIVDNGNLSDASKAALVEKVGKEQADVLLAGAQGEVTKLQDKQKAENNAVFEAIGGEATWLKIAEWSRSDTKPLTEVQSKTYNAMLAAGGLQAQMAAKALKDLYMADPSITTAAGVIPGDAAAGAPVTQVISRRDYIVQKAKAIRENNPDEVAKLEARARSTMATAPGKWRI